MMLFAIMIGVPLILVLWLAIFLDWRRGIWMVIVFLPVAGVVTLALRPNPVGTLLKDLLFLLPTYVIFGLLHLQELRKTRVPQTITFLFLALSTLVLIQLFNPNITRIVIALVGVKVWLFYLPLVYISGAFFRTPDDLLKVLRVCIAMALIPCGVGITEFLLSSTIGYKATMIMIYGGQAAAVTQKFGSFFMGAEFFRIPSTFTYVTQYSGYCLMMIPLVYMHGAIEPDARWRAFSRFMLGFVFVACMLSGARANFFFAPLLFLTILFLDAKLKRLAIGVIFAPIIMVSTLDAVGLDVLGVFGATSGLVSSYGSDLVIPELIQSILGNPFGQGVGMNTGQALNIMSQRELALVHNIEGFYSKSAIELGFAGLMLVVMIFAALNLYGFGVRTRLKQPMARTLAATILAFIMIMTLHSGKGWQIELDPINVWYWMLAGILFKLPYMDFTELARRRGEADAEAESRKHRRRPQMPRPRGAPARSMR
jgi:hypothetical protein